MANFFIGLVAGAWIFSLLAVLQAWMYRRLLANKGDSDYPSAERLDGKFYYIVPESKYVDMTLTAIRDSQADAGTNSGEVKHG